MDRKEYLREWHNKHPNYNTEYSRRHREKFPHYQKELYAKHRTKRLEEKRIFWEKNRGRICAKRKAMRPMIREHLNAKQRIWYKQWYGINRSNLSLERERMKRRVMDAYGSVCACCGEHRLEFLTIDHIDGGGTQHRIKIKKNGSQFYCWLVKNKYPEGYRVLCFNCNCSMGMKGYCPHQKEKELQSQAAD
jgi:hypothetical protein